MKQRSLGVAIAAAVLSLAAGMVPAPAQGTAIVAVPGSYLTPTYGQPAAVALVGGEMTFANLDIQRHDVQAVQKPGQYAPVQCTSPTPSICPEGTPTWCLPPDPTQPWTQTGGENDLPFPPGTCPIFWSALIGVGRTTPVLGLEYLTSGTAYEFLCSIHRPMRGTLVAV